MDKATCEWILSIDADEVLSPELEAEIEKILSTNPKEIGFKLQWAITIFGKRLNYGRGARSIVKFFKREGAYFTNAIIHEKVITPKGKIGKLVF